MRRILLFGVAGLAVLISGVGYSRSEPKVSDEGIRRLRAEFPGMIEKCIALLRYEGVEAVPRETDQCFQMMPPQRWKGLWRNDFEGQRFCPSPSTECSPNPSEDYIWLTFAGDRPPKEAEMGRIYRVEFTGRRTLREGHYGHGGLAQHEIIVDHLISIAPAD